MNLKVAKGIFLFSLGAMIVIGTFGLLLYLAHHPIPDGNQRMLDMGYGVILGAFTTVIGYFFGSSQGSAEKSEIIHDSIEKTK